MIGRMTATATGKPQSAWESSLNWFPTLFLVAILSGTVWAVNFFWNYQGSAQERAFLNLQATATALAYAPVEAGYSAPTVPATVAATVPAVVEDPPAVRYTPTPFDVPAVLIVTATPTPEPTLTPTPYYVYIDNPVEVEATRIVPVTVTPVPLAPGVVRICASVEGARELYINGDGIVSGQCKEYTVGVGANYVQVQINR